MLNKERVKMKEMILINAKMEEKIVHCARFTARW